MCLLFKAQTRFLFHAHIKIKIPVFCPESCFDELFGVMERIDKLYNSYTEGSYIDLINRSAGSFVAVDTETVLLLQRVKKWSEFFSGAFDISIMPLIRLWGFYKTEGVRVPTREELASTLQQVNYQKIEIHGQQVRIGCRQELITGSFLKAYAVDKMVERMTAMGITDAIINAGGSTIRAINNEAHPQWTVNVRRPEDGSLLYVLKVGNKCYTTSSQSETFVIINGRHYGHILNPLTGYPSANKQVGIITNSCMDGDIISTGLFLQTAKGFATKMRQLQQLMDIEGYLVDEKGHVIETDGFQHYKKQ